MGGKKSDGKRISVKAAHVISTRHLVSNKGQRTPFDSRRARTTA